VTRPALSSSAGATSAQVLPGGAKDVQFLPADGSQRGQAGPFRGGPAAGPRRRARLRVRRPPL